LAGEPQGLRRAGGERAGLGPFGTDLISPIRLPIALIVRPLTANRLFFAYKTMGLRNDRSLEALDRANTTTWGAAIAGATTWRRVSSSGGIAAAESVSANATGRRHERGSRGSRSSSAPRRGIGDRARKGSAPFQSVRSVI